MPHLCGDDPSRHVVRSDLAGALRAGGYGIGPAGVLDCRAPMARGGPVRADRTALDAVAFAYAAGTLPGSKMPGFYLNKVALKVNPARPVTITSATSAYFVWGNYGLPACLQVTVTDRRGRQATVPLALGTACPKA
jgi:hypothetical protein